MSEKTEVHNNIGQEKAIQEIMKKKAEILENFSKAYLAETGLKPSDVMLVEERSEKIIDGKFEINYYFRRKKNGE